MIHAIRFKSEGRVVYAPRITTAYIPGWRPPNPLYPDCPMGLRVTDLPRGWASAGMQLALSAGAGKPRTPKLTPDEVTEIRAAVEVGVSCTRLAAHYGVALSTITRLARGETWSSVS
jgi:hypothetical protein